ncbi:MAG: hypothetical protein NPMRTHETA2_490010 [Nitrosopumilales archaeon]|nr:MAG: hypothetical protein NPMRTHETA2_490010 [Nitrosopumilales archaeon]
MAENEDETSIRINKKTHKDLVKIQGSIQAKIGKHISFDEVLQEFIQDYKKRHK